MRRPEAVVAIKFIAKEPLRRTKRRDLIARVQSEVSIHQELAHPAITALHTFFEDDRHVYLVMEYCANGDLHHYLRRKKRLEEGLARRLFRQIVTGMLYLHERGIMHRDIKLGNILLTDTYDAVNRDFGMTKSVAENCRLWTRSASGGGGWGGAQDALRHSELHLPRDCQWPGV